MDTIPSLRIQTDRLDGHALLSVAGEIDMSSAPELNEALAQLAREETPVTVDLDDVTFMDSTGLHALFTFASTTNGNGPVRIVNASRTILRTMQIVGMTKAPQIEVQGADGHDG